MNEKLVRDGVPALIERETGVAPAVRRAVGDELVGFLKCKLVEEAGEVAAAGTLEEVLDELADLREVLEACCRALGSHPYQLEKRRWAKRDAKGGFDRGTVMRTPPDA